MGPENTGDRSEKTLQFLVGLLKHSNDGKVDWKEYIKDMDISTVNAAKKRFKRMMDPHGITERALTAFTAKDGTPKKQGAAKKKKSDCDTSVIVGTDTESNKSSPTKKRKIMMVVDPATASEDDGELEKAVEKSRAGARAGARARARGLLG